MIKNRAALVKYLTENPYVRLNRTITGKGTGPRRFVGATTKEFVFETQDGMESYLTVKAKDLTFRENGFDVHLGAMTLHYDFLAGEERDVWVNKDGSWKVVTIPT